METRKTVLIVEDDELVLESIDLHLSLTGHLQTIRVRGAAGATTHLQSVSTLNVIVADVILGGPISGIDLCLQAIERHPDIAIVVITADTEIHRADIPPRGVLLRKPFGGEQLWGAIEVALERVGRGSAEG